MFYILLNCSIPKPQFLDTARRIAVCSKIENNRSMCCESTTFGFTNLLILGCSVLLLQYEVEMNFTNQLNQNLDTLFTDFLMMKTMIITCSLVPIVSIMTMMTAANSTYPSQWNIILIDVNTCIVGTTLNSNHTVSLSSHTLRAFCSNKILLSCHKLL